MNNFAKIGNHDRCQVYYRLIQGNWK